MQPDIEPEGIVCQPHIDAANLPGRDEHILARERASFAGMVESVSSGAGKGVAAEEPALTTAVLHRAIAGDDVVKRYSAAFLLGRCRADDPKADARLTELAVQVLDNADMPRDVAIEAAMSAVLRGKREKGRAFLARAAKDPDPFADAYKAAFFLAQLGDPSGYPAVVRTLESDIAHYRLMALRHLIVFRAFDGQEVGGMLIDVRARMVDRTRDTDPLVRVEVPFLLEELAPPRLERTLRDMLANDSDEQVRNAIKTVLERIKS